jgi:hypothetical protein
MRAGIALRACAVLLLSAAAKGQVSPPGPLPPPSGGPVTATGQPSVSTRPLPRFPSAIDPVTSAPAPGALPELSAPLLDIVAGTLQASPSGAVVKGTIAPFLFLRRPVPVLSETRVEIHGASSELQPWGGSVSLGYSSATALLQLSDTEQASITSLCAQDNPAAYEDAIQAAQQLAGALERATNTRIGPLQYGEAPNAYISRVFVAWKNLNDRALADGLATQAAVLRVVMHAADDRLGDCWIEKAAAQRMRKAYANGFSARASVGADWFPIINGPDVAEAAGEPASDPSPHSLAMWNVGASFGYFADRDTRVWLTGSFSRKRSKPVIEALDSRLGVGVDIAHNFTLGKVDAAGFAAGVGLGGFATFQKCLDDDECPESIAAYKDVVDPISASTITSLGAYVDIRSSATLQLRIGAPFTKYTLEAGTAGNASEAQIWGFAPTISLSVASWSLVPATSY